jgi:hypothetical protein
VTPPRHQRGSQTLELVAGLPLLAMALLAALQGVVLVRQQLEAQTDAALLARHAALCDAGEPAPTLAGIDPAAGPRATVAPAPVRPPLVGVTVRLAPHSIIPGLALTGGPWIPAGTAVFRLEPCRPSR